MLTVLKQQISKSSHERMVDDLNVYVVICSHCNANMQ